MATTPANEEPVPSETASAEHTHPPEHPGPLPEAQAGSVAPDRVDSATAVTKQQVPATAATDPVTAPAPHEETKGADALPLPSKSKKRLTLQERLALAAKGKAKKGPEASSETPTPERSRTPEAADDTALLTKNSNAVSPAEISVSKLQSKINELTRENEVLRRSKSNQEIAKKDELINQLMKEGEQLSIKELKLNETIKKLKNTNSELEDVVQELNGKVEENLIKVNDFEDLLKTHQLKTLDQLKQKLYHLNDLENKVNTASEIDQKFQDQVKLYEQVLETKNQKVKELNDLTIQFDLLKQNHLLELNAKDELIESLKAEKKALNREFQSEILRLEDKIEVLRTERENDSSSRTLDNGSVDNNDFLKLSNSHSNLQSEYLKSQENWKLIESNLNTKIESLNLVIDNLKSNKINLINENKKLKHTTTTQDKEIQKLRHRLEQIQKEVEELQLQNRLHASEKNEISEKLNNINAIFSKERQSLNTTINQLQAKIDKFRNDSFSENFSQLDEIKFNESAFEHTHSSAASQSFLNEDFDNVSNEDSETSRIPAPSAYVNSNFHLINKMTNSIKRLEVELNSLREENAILTKDKERLQADIIKYLDIHKEHAKVLKNYEELEVKFHEKEKKEQDLLELIGEKEERVDELTNDVQDLKDLMKLQVQQLMEIQERCSK